MTLAQRCEAVASLIERKAVVNTLVEQWLARSTRIFLLKLMLLVNFHNADTINTQITWALCV